MAKPRTVFTHVRNVTGHDLGEFRDTNKEK